MPTVSQIMKTEVLTVSRRTPIYEAIELMVANNVTGLPVVDEEMLLVGIITEKDVLSLLYNFEDKAGNVEDYMTEEVLSFECESSLKDVSASFKRNHFRRVPIVEKGRIVGIVSRRDVIRYISEMKREADVVGGDMRALKR